MYIIIYIYIVFCYYTWQGNGRRASNFFFHFWAISRTVLKMLRCVRFITFASKRIEKTKLVVICSYAIRQDIFFFFKFVTKGRMRICQYIYDLLLLLDSFFNFNVSGHISESLIHIHKQKDKQFCHLKWWKGV